MKKYKYLVLLAILVLPAVTSAQLTGVKDLITAFGDLINPLIIILVGVALLVFLWGLVKFIFRLGGSEDAVKEGKRIMIWGLVALFVMVSVWGIIAFVSRDLNLPAGDSINNFFQPISPSPSPSPLPPCHPNCGPV